MGSLDPLYPQKLPFPHLRSLPITFFENVPKDVSDVDLLIIIGTSLRVAPANSLVWRVPKTSMRLLVNREPVGWHLGVAYGPDSTRDVFAQGNCDYVLLDLMAHLGWLDDLEPLLEEHKLPESSAALLRKRLGNDDSDGDGDDGSPDE
jgi:NAD+-dependent protein deacetylase sirtuin 2